MSYREKWTDYLLSVFLCHKPSSLARHPFRNVCHLEEIDLVVGCPFVATGDELKVVVEPGRCDDIDPSPINRSVSALSRASKMTDGQFWRYINSLSRSPYQQVLKGMIFNRTVGMHDSPLRSEMPPVKDGWTWLVCVPRGITALAWRQHYTNPQTILSDAVIIIWIIFMSGIRIIDCKRNGCFSFKWSHFLYL